MNGANVGLVETMTVRHPLANEKDAANYVAALGQVSTRMEEAIAESRRLAAQEHHSSEVHPQRDRQADAGLRRSRAGARIPLSRFFAQKMEAAKIPEARREDLRARSRENRRRSNLPGLEEGHRHAPVAASACDRRSGFWRFKGGADAYAYFLRRYTTTNLTADQIHEIGLDEVARIEKQMDTILRSLGRTEGSVKDRIEKLKEDLRLSQDRGRPRDHHGRRGTDPARRAKSAPRCCSITRPKSPVVAQAFPRFREANAAANYNSPAPDGSRPGVFQIPLRPERMTKFGLRSLVYHETVPGHHFQIALEVENKDLPRFRQIGAFGTISALVEGWGLYAERLAAESGWYDGDPEGLLGQLDSALFRARRLVVDTGIHAKHWTRQQAIDYGIEASEVERYVVFPGQACSYMIGQLKIVELREKARKALGAKFSLREFHNRGAQHRHGAAGHSGTPGGRVDQEAALTSLTIVCHGAYPRAAE